MLFQVFLEDCLALFEVVETAVDAVKVGSVFGVVLLDRGAREMVSLMRGDERMSWYEKGYERWYMRGGMRERTREGMREDIQNTCRTKYNNIQHIFKHPLRCSSQVLDGFNDISPNANLSRSLETH